MQELKGSRMGTEKIPKLMMELAIPSIIAQVINILYNIVIDGNWVWVLNGVLAVLMMFVHAVMCDEALRGAND